MPLAFGSHLPRRVEPPGRGPDCHRCADGHAERIVVGFTHFDRHRHADGVTVTHTLPNGDTIAVTNPLTESEPDA